MKHKIFLLTLMLALVSTGAMAKLTKIGEDDEATFTQYVYNDTIRKKGSRVKMWNLKDFKTVQEDKPEDENAGGKYLSMKMQREYDCKEERSRWLTHSMFSKNMAAGEHWSYVGDPGDWHPVIPDSMGEKLWNIACGKK